MDCFLINTIVICDHLLTFMSVQIFKHNRKYDILIMIFFCPYSIVN